MTMSPRTISTLLTYCGALPFWLLAFAPSTVLGFETAPAFVSYGAVIASFMAGALWGSAQSGRGDLVIIVASNVLALAAFATLIASPLPIALLVQLLLFALLLIADHRIHAGATERQWYWTLRVRITLLVALAYCVMLFRYAF
jgi:hypothetical protein